MVAKKLKDLGRRVVEAVDNATDVTLDAVVDFHKGVKDKGGYLEAGKEVVSSVIDSTRQTYQSIEDALCTDGKFDSEKAKRLLADNAEAVKNYGSKAARVLADFASDGTVEIREITKDKFRKFVPTEEERARKYAGIGTAYTGVLFRQNYEECLAFHRTVNEKIPRGLKLKTAILSDIKANASSNVEELTESYVTALKANLNLIETLDKFKAIQKYLVNPA